MTKIIKIKVENLKAISKAELDLNECSVIVTAKNGTGKTTLLRSLADRIQSKKPDLIVKKGEANGFAEWTLSDGCKIIWKFTEKSESLIYETAQGFQIKSGVIEQLQKKYFGSSKGFDINKFMLSSTKDQRKTLLNLVGVDLTDIDLKYDIAYSNRTRAKADFKLIASQIVKLPEPFQFIDVTPLKKERSDLLAIKENRIKEIRAENDKIKKSWYEKNEVLRKKVDEFNRIQNERETEILHAKYELNSLNLAVLSKFFLYDDAEAYINCLPEPEARKIFTPLPDTEYIDETVSNEGIEKLDQQIESVILNNSNFYAYKEKKKNYDSWVAAGSELRKKVEFYESEVLRIENEKKELLKNAKMPDGFSVTEDGILYNGFEFNDKAQSTSAIYIAGLKLAAMNLGELKSIHFEASSLDYDSLLEVEKFANESDLQLLIEYPTRNKYDKDFTYEILSNL